MSLTTITQPLDKILIPLTSPIGNAILTALHNAKLNISILDFLVTTFFITQPTLLVIVIVVLCLLFYLLFAGGGGNSGGGVTIVRGGKRHKKH